MKTILLCSLLVSMASAAQAASPVLELRNTNGPGSLTKDIIVYSDGTVTATHLVSPPANESQPQLIAQLSSYEMAGIENSIGAIQEGDLVRTDPSQQYNPGGFVSTYILTDANGKAFTFAKNVSGVDFGLSNSQGRDLVATLQSLNNLPVGN